MCEQLDKTVPEQAKKQAQRLRHFLRHNLKKKAVTLQLADSLEAVAYAVYGQPNWNTLTGLARQHEPAAGSPPPALGGARAQAQARGFVVRPDPDQPGLWLWRCGQEGSDCSFATEAEAWAAAAAAARLESEASPPSVLLEFVELGEGHAGDYDPGNDTDEELLRLDVTLTDAQGNCEQHSVCTQVPVTTSAAMRQQWLDYATEWFRVLAQDVTGHTSARVLVDMLSWQNDTWDGTLPQMAVILAKAKVAPPNLAKQPQLPLYVPRGQPLSASVLRELTADGGKSLDCLVAVDLTFLLDNDIEGLNDEVSEVLTGSCAGLMDIDYAVWHEAVPQYKRNDSEVLLRVTALWEEYD